MEEKYYELLERKDRAIDNYYKAISERTPLPAIATAEMEKEIAENEFNAFCAYVLEKLLEDNADVLSRLKNNP